MTNISGDLAVTTIVAKWNGAVDFTQGAWVGEHGDSGVVADDD